MRRVLLLVALLVGFSIAVGPTASAQVPGFGDCKEEPEPEYPGSGFVGQLDTAPPSQTIPGSVYDEVGYAGLVWHTYDLGCIPGPNHIAAPTNTFVGNLLFDAAKVIVAATNGLHGIITEGGFLDRFDDLIVETSHTMYTGVFSPWFGLVGVLLGVTLFRAGMTGNLAAAGTKLLYAAGALFLASATYMTPLLYTGLLDELAVDGVNQLRSQVLGIAGIDAAHALPNTLHEQVVWRPWLQGEFGSANSRHAAELGRDLVHAQAFTQQEVAAGRTGEDAVEAKKEQFKQVADRAGAAYPYMQGINDARLGAGMTALFKALVFAPFQLLTDAGLLLLQLLLRVIVMFGPVLGLIALLRGGVLLQTAMGIVGALLQALLLAAAGCLHLIALMWITDPDRGLSVLFQLITMLLLTALLWKAVKPGERFRSILNSAGGVVGLSGLSRSERLLRRMHKGHKRRRRRDLFARAQDWFGPHEWLGPNRGDTGQRSEAETATQDEHGPVHAYAQRMHWSKPGDEHPGLDRGPVRPEGDPGRGGNGATGHRPQTPGASGPRPGAVWAASERTDRRRTPATRTITRGAPALPPAEPDSPPSRPGSNDPGPGQPPESRPAHDPDLFVPPGTHGGPGDDERRVRPTRRDDPAWEVYRPEDDDRPQRGRRPEEGEG